MRTDQETTQLNTNPKGVFCSTHDHELFVDPLFVDVVDMSLNSFAAVIVQSCLATTWYVVHDVSETSHANGIDILAKSVGGT